MFSQIVTAGLTFLWQPRRSVTITSLHFLQNHIFPFFYRITSFHSSTEPHHCISYPRNPDIRSTLTGSEVVFPDYFTCQIISLHGSFRANYLISKLHSAQMSSYIKWNGHKFAVNHSHCVVTQQWLLHITIFTITLGTLRTDVALTLPVAISITTQPRDQMSAARPYPSCLLWVMTSGAMYAVCWKNRQKCNNSVADIHTRAHMENIYQRWQPFLMMV